MSEKKTKTRKTNTRTRSQKTTSLKEVSQVDEKSILGNHTAKFTFFYLISLITLVAASLSICTIIFQIINKTIIDILDNWQGRYFPEALKNGISTLFISAPIYFFIMSRIYKNLQSGLLDRNSQLRKWLTYLVLLISGIAFFSWLIGIMNSFLDGELTLKFILKAITALGIAGLIFSFYFYDIKRDDFSNKEDKITKFYFLFSIILVIIVFVSSLFFVESPRQARNRRIDEKTLERFTNIGYAINDYYEKNKNLPFDLDVLINNTNLDEKNLENISTKKRFDYHILGKNKYELCADFLISNKDDNLGKNIDYFIDTETFFDEMHDVGYQCLDKKIIERKILEKELDEQMTESFRKLPETQNSSEDIEDLLEIKEISSGTEELILQ